jgi:hypothetical protein
MSIKKISLLTSLKSVPAAVAFALLVLVSGKSTSSNSPGPANHAPVAEERRVQVMKSPYMPADTTVAIVGIRNLQNEHWLRDLEIEVQNNSKKPVYFLSIMLSFPDIPKTTEADGLERGIIIVLKFGRTDLSNRGQRATAQDPSIGPGEKYVLMVHREQYRGFESFMSRHDFPPSLTRSVRLNINSIRFADGSGFEYTRPHISSSNHSLSSGKRQAILNCADGPGTCTWLLAGGPLA